MKQIQLRETRFRPGNPAFFHQLFSAKAARSGGIVRRAVRDVEREVGRSAMIAEVERRGFHLLECAGQFIVICAPDHLTVHV
ncbi:hypothetical protein [Cognatiyoonia sp. IB215182]|uniref:hypothetical protein n=1 Tax=Cognatiyoonia sp. IB215182 TaxID=3097353 RepID=UPI002A130D1E|nr:hypothetical protein [Cognatiyoonia sp. IB215182]MDX8352900.1 hypothetical protein [Cognatiyoonia sp. IB215182]